MPIETFLAAYTAAALIAFGIGYLYGVCPPAEKPKAPEQPPGVIFMKKPPPGAS